MYTKRLYILLAIFVITSCASSTPVATTDLPAAEPDKGLVIFYRMSSMSGKTMRFDISYEGGSIGQLLSGTVLHKQLEPGKHSFSTQGVSVDGADSITVNIEAGETYYFKGRILPGWPAGRPKFSQVTESEAQKGLAKL